MQSSGGKIPVSHCPGENFMGGEIIRVVVFQGRIMQGQLSGGKSAEGIFLEDFMEGNCPRGQLFKGDLPLIERYC